MSALTSEPAAAAEALLAPPADVYELSLRVAAARRPPLAVRVLTAEEVALAVRHALDEGLDVDLGTEPVDGCLVLDLSGMKRFVIDARAGTARVQPGVSVEELEQAAALYGLRPLVDRGRLSVVNLIRAQVVTWDGSIVRVSAAESPAMLGFVVDATYRLTRSPKRP